MSSLEQDIRDSIKNDVLSSFIGGKSVSIISKNLNLKTKVVEAVIRDFLNLKMKW